MNVTHGNLACWQHRELYDGDTKEKKKLKAFPNCQHFRRFLTINKFLKNRIAQIRGFFFLAKNQAAG